MATSNYTEEEILFRRRARRRLVGAVVLVVTVIAVVPLILPENKPQQETQQIEIRIPTQDATGYAPKIMLAPSPESAVMPTPETAIAAVAAPTNKPEVKPVEHAAQAQSLAEPAKQDKPKTATPGAAPVKATTTSSKDSASSKPAVPPKQTYFVQYGAFSEQKNAKQRQAELKVKGINTFTEVVKTSAGNKVRVRSGPYDVREDAEKIRTKVKPLETKLVVMGNNP